MKVNLVKATELAPNGVEKQTCEYYTNKAKNPVKVGKIGPVILGKDVGAMRWSDIHYDYPIYELATTEVEHKDFDLGGYRVRWFHPTHITGLAPVIFFVHGGGYMTGTIERYDKIHRRLAELIDGIVVHVDYTLCPETSFPTALEQSFHAIEWMVTHNEEYHIDPEKVAIMGDSAGGNCCAALGLRDRETKYVKLNFLYYPAVDMTMDSRNKFDLSKYGENLDELIVKRIMGMANSIGGMNDVFLQHGEDPRYELISPLHSENLKGYPRTVMIVAEYDYLTQESEAFAEKLEENGVQVECYKFEGTFHAFLDRLGYFESSDMSLKLVAEKMREQFNY